MNRTLITIALLFNLFGFYSAKCQQSTDTANANIFFAQFVDIQSNEKLRNSRRPDSSDFYALFADSLVLKAIAVQACWKLFWSDAPAFRDASLDPDFINTQLKEIDVHVYSTEKFHSYQWWDQKKKIFKDPQQMFYDIDRGDGSHWAYFARYWTYINGRWVVFEDLPRILYQIVVVDEIPNCVPKK